MIQRTYRLLRTSYERAPLPLQKIACCLPYGWLAGSTFGKTMRLCQRLDSVSRQDIVRLQEAELGRLPEFAVAQVPFYGPLRSTVHRLRPFDALREFPLFSKADVQKNSEKLIPRSIREIPHHEGTTPTGQARSGCSEEAGGCADLPSGDERVCRHFRNLSTPVGSTWVT
jgi:hypothetical protein